LDDLRDGVFRETGDMNDLVVAEDGFVRALRHLRATVECEKTAAAREDCAAGLLKSAAHQRALGMGLLLEGLVESQ
jgi:hypothetical protein